MLGFEVNHWRLNGLLRPAVCAACGMALFALCLLLACSKDASVEAKGEDPRKKLVIPVSVGVAVQKTVPVQISAIGNVQAFSTVVVKSKVGGELVEVHFREGQELKKGAMLFTIDPKPFEAQLRQAEAALARDKAQLLNARKQAERYASVVQKGFVSQEQYDQIATSAAAYEASVKADEAAAETARLNLKYCSIQCPIDGTAGELKVHQGNLVKDNDSDKPLVTVNQVSPIYVSFSVPAQNLPEIRRNMASKKLQVQATVPDSGLQPALGELVFVDNAVDTATGTILLKASFPNRDRALWPGQFVNVVLTLSTLPDAVTLPSQAVQSGQEGQFVFVVKPDSTVEYRLVSLGRNFEDEIVVAKGISPGEKVVTDGHLRLNSGMQVRIVENGSGSGEKAAR